MKKCRACKKRKSTKAFEVLKKYPTSIYRDHTCVACRSKETPRIRLFDKEELINTFDSDIVFALYLRCTKYWNYYN